MLPSSPSSPDHHQQQQRHAPRRDKQPLRLSTTRMALVGVIFAASLLCMTNLAVFRTLRHDPHGYVDTDSPFAPGSLNVILYSRTPRQERATPESPVGMGDSSRTVDDERPLESVAVHAAVESYRKLAPGDQEDPGSSNTPAPNNVGTLGKRADTTGDVVDEDDFYAAAEVEQPQQQEEGQGPRRGLQQARSSASDGEQPRLRRVDGAARLAAFLDAAPPPREQLDLLTRTQTVCSIVVVIPRPADDAFAAPPLPGADVESPEFSYAVSSKPNRWLRRRHALRADSSSASREDVSSGGSEPSGGYLLARARSDLRQSKMKRVLQKGSFHDEDGTLAQQRRDASSLTANHATRDARTSSIQRALNDTGRDDSARLSRAFVDLDIVASRGPKSHRLKLFEALRIVEYEQYLNRVLYRDFSTHALPVRRRDLGKLRDDGGAVCPRRHIYVITSNRTSLVGGLARLLNFGGLLSTVTATERLDSSRRGLRSQARQSTGEQADHDTEQHRDAADIDGADPRSSIPGGADDALLFLDASLTPVRPMDAFFAALHRGLVHPIVEPRENEVPGASPVPGDGYTRASSSAGDEPMDGGPGSRIVGCTVTAKGSVVSQGIGPVLDAHGDLAMAHRMSGFTLLDRRVALESPTRVLTTSPMCFAIGAHAWRRLGGLRTVPAHARVVETFLLAGSRYRTAAYHAEISLMSLDPLMRSLRFARAEGQLFDMMRTSLVRALDDIVRWEGFAVDAGMDRMSVCPAAVRRTLHGHLFTLLPLYSVKSVRDVVDDAVINNHTHNVSLAPTTSSPEDDAANDFSARAQEGHMWQASLDFLVSEFGAQNVVDLDYDLVAEKAHLQALIQEFVRIQAAGAAVGTAEDRRDEAERSMFAALQRESANVRGGAGHFAPPSDVHADDESTSVQEHARRRLQQINDRAAAARLLKSGHRKAASDEAFDRLAHAIATDDIGTPQDGDGRPRGASDDGIVSPPVSGGAVGDGGQDKRTEVGDNAEGSGHQSRDSAGNGGSPGRTRLEHVRSVFNKERKTQEAAKRLLAHREAELLRLVLRVVQRHVRLLMRRRADARKAAVRLQALCVTGDDPFWELSLAASRHVVLDGRDGIKALRPSVERSQLVNPMKLYAPTVMTAALVAPVDIAALLTNFSQSVPVAGSAVLAPYVGLLRTVAARPLPPSLQMTAEEHASSSSAKLPPLSLGGVRVTWAGACCSCCGFSTEMALILAPLSTYVPTRSTLPLSCHCSGMPRSVAGTLRRMAITRDDGSLHRSEEGDLQGWAESNASLVRIRAEAAKPIDDVDAQRRIATRERETAGRSAHHAESSGASGARSASDKSENERQAAESAAVGLLWSDSLNQPVPPIEHTWSPVHSNEELPELLRDLRLPSEGSWRKKEGNDLSNAVVEAPAVAPLLLRVGNRSDPLASLHVRAAGVSSSPAASADDGDDDTPGHDPSLGGSTPGASSPVVAAPLSSPDSVNPPVEVWVFHLEPVQARRIAWPEATVDYKLSRSMFEFSRISMTWAKMLADDDEYDEIWVPCTFVRDAFVSSGVPQRKVRIVPEPIDTLYYDPVTATKIDLPPSIGRPGWRGRGSRGYRRADNEPLRQNFKFFSMFKWEPRKGWDVLLRAYFTAFTRSDPVSLYILTYMWWAVPPPDSDPRNQDIIWDAIMLFVRRDLRLDPDDLPHFEIITQDVTEAEILSMYATCDVFVLPTRGEGWGLPVIQAMSMAVPTLVTRYSGPLHFTTNDTVRYIELTGIVDVGASTTEYGGLPDMQWAAPNATQLRLLMREMTFDWTPQERHALGQRARAHVRRHFDSHVVASQIARRLREIEGIVRRRIAAGLQWRGNTTAGKGVLDDGGLMLTR